ncbi:hypothetical protein [Vibrio nigripulchritudo]|uniref:hypothetical protein n=1 Tax=Vibrio nigripulchritudo TaxID=28173 RepID=UPI0024916EFB|nr:hypothetical protein [Vibrio nigripulchritudo]BDU46889.1 hypothetical protein TUMSATVNIG3_56870 [Vibrio nigripulchritudo]
MIELSAISGKARMAYKIVKSWFSKSECLDPSTMDVELNEIRLANLGTAIEVSLRVRNHGLTDLNIHSIHADISVAQMGFSTSPTPTYDVIPSECSTGQLVRFIIQAPFLLETPLVEMMNDHHNIDLMSSDSPVTVAVSALTLSISRNKQTHTIQIPDIRDHTTWQKDITGLHHYLDKKAS